MKIAAVQAAPVFLDPTATTHKALTLLQEATAAEAETVVFPEVFLSGYPVWLRAPEVAYNDALLKTGHVAYLNSAVSTNGPEVTAIVDEARRLGVFVYIGIVEQTGSGGSIYAALVAIHPEKGIVSVHRKLKPTFHERLIWADGDGHGMRVHEWQGLKFGGLNCYENWQPLARQALYNQGEQVHIATWPGDLDVTENITQFIALEGRMYCVSVSGLLRAQDIPDNFPLREQVVKGRDVINDGGSMIAGPDGKLIAGPVVGEEQILYADISSDVVLGARLKLDPAGHYSRRDVLSLDHNTRRLD